jgi:hypothetical protein
MMMTFRFPASMYTADGRKMTDKVWEEMKAELAFADVQKVLDEMRRAT